MPDLSAQFSRKAWKKCCTKGCKKCELAQTYIRELGRDKGIKQLKADREAVLAQPKKSGKKGGKKKHGKKK